MLQAGLANLPQPPLNPITDDRAAQFLAYGESDSPVPSTRAKNIQHEYGMYVGSAFGINSPEVARLAEALQTRQSARR